MRSNQIITVILIGIGLLLTGMLLGIALLRYVMPNEQPGTYSVDSSHHHDPLSDLLDAIEQVESGGDCSAVGDGGRSIGPLQIQRAYWIDSGVPGRYEQVTDGQYARRVVLAYWQRYAPPNATHEQLARIHNGGPRGHTKPQTRSYWARVQRELSWK